jgi:hypothetical protein
MRLMFRTSDLVAVVLGAVSLFALGYAVNDLADGITEVPHHWWSSAPLLGLGAALALWAAPRLLGRRTRRAAA